MIVHNDAPPLVVVSVVVVVFKLKNQVNFTNVLRGQLEYRRRRHAWCLQDTDKVRILSKKEGDSLNT